MSLHEKLDINDVRQLAVNAGFVFEGTDAHNTIAQRANLAG